MSIEAIGQFVTPQNRASIPVAAQRDGEIPKTCPNRHPNVAPVKKAGTISPPLYPAARVRAVHNIFKRKAQAGTFPSIALAIISVPAPL